MVNFIDWSVFGHKPSLNYRFNRMATLDEVPKTPFFCCGAYSDYYCLITDAKLCGGHPLLNYDADDNASLAYNIHMFKEEYNA